MGWRARTTAAVAVLLGCGPPSAWHGLSPDHLRTFTVSESEGRTCIAVDGGEDRCYEGIALPQIVFSPDGGSLSYPVRQGERWLVIRDGEPGPVVDGIGEMTFSRDGARLAYTAQTGDTWHVVVDGDFGQPFDSLVSGTLLFGPQGRRVAFAGYRGSETVVVVDGVAGPGHAGVARLRFSEDGRSFAYLARDADAVRLYVDGVVEARGTSVESFVLGPAGGLVAYVLREGGEAWVVRGGRRWGPYRQARDLRLRGDGALLFVARDAEGERVVVDGRAEPPYASVEAPVVSAEGSAWGYVAHDSAGSVVVLDGASVDQRTWIGDLALNPGGDRYAYLTRGVDADVVVDDRGFTRFDMVVDGTLQFTDGGARWACLAGTLEDRRLFVAVEGHPDTRPFEWSDFTGVADGRSTAGLRSGAAEEALRAWVAAESALILSQVR